MYSLTSTKGDILAPGLLSSRSAPPHYDPQPLVKPWMSKGLGVFKILFGLGSIQSRDLAAKAFTARYKLPELCGPL